MAPPVSVDSRGSADSKQYQLRTTRSSEEHLPHQRGTDGGKGAFGSSPPPLPWPPMPYQVFGANGDNNSGNSRATMEHSSSLCLY